MKRVPGYIVAGMLIVTAVLWTTRSSADEGGQGKTLYENKCMICHGTKGDGNGSAAAFLSSKPAVFTDSKFWKDHDDKQIEDTIRNGKGEMPSFDLNPGELKSVIAYITHTFKPLNK
jgi:mono/diheme cytochrome c family protein